MAAFPILSTGAVAQYPLARGTNFIVDIVRFWTVLSSDR